MPRNCPLDNEAEATWPGVGGSVVWKSVVDVDGALIGNISEFEIAFPGFATVIVAEPGEAIKFAGTAADNWLELMNVVVSVAPFQRTNAPERKP